MFVCRLNNADQLSKVLCRWEDRPLVPVGRKRSANWREKENAAAAAANRSNVLGDARNVLDSVEVALLRLEIVLMTHPEDLHHHVTLLVLALPHHAAAALA